MFPLSGAGFAERLNKSSAARGWVAILFIKESALCFSVWRAKELDREHGAAQDARGPTNREGVGTDVRQSGEAEAHVHERHGGATSASARQSSRGQGGSSGQEILGESAEDIWLEWFFGGRTHGT